MTVPLGDASYEILLGEGLLDDLPRILEQHSPAHRYAIITDSTVGRLYGEHVVSQLGGEPRCGLFAFAAGERNKTRDTWASLTDQLLSAEFGRDTVVVALGGGVVGDVAGFLAATYLRGVPYVQVPTTLLAMIDSSIGGKTGVDTRAGKNLVGVFHQPAVVIADITTLATLPTPQISAGMAEAIKHGAIADAEYFSWLVAEHESILGRDPVVLLEVVRRSIQIKATVVTEDERDRGKRAILNFGHTVAHSLEATTEYELLHGEAVALGMLAEADLGIRLGVTLAEVRARLDEAVRILGLPLQLSGNVDPQRLLEAMAQDKKRRGGTVRFALLERLGRMARDPHGEWTHAAPESEIQQMLEGFSLTTSPPTT